MGKPQPRSRHKTVHTVKVATLTQAMAIPPKTRKYIKQHYESMPRRQIAKALGLDKVTLNLMIIDMGLRRSEQG